MTCDFRRLDARADFFFRPPVPRGRPAVSPADAVRERIVALRQHNLSVPEIKARLDADEPRSPSESTISKVLQQEGFPRGLSTDAGPAPPRRLSRIHVVTQRAGSFEVSLSIGMAAQGCFGDAPVVIGCGIAGVQFDRLAEVGDRLS